VVTSCLVVLLVRLPWSHSNANVVVSKIQVNNHSTNSHVAIRHCRGTILTLSYERCQGSRESAVPARSTVVSRNATRPCQENSRRPLRSVARSWATAPSLTMSRLQSCVATDSEDVLRPGVTEGRNTILRRGRCASPVSESVHDRNGASGRVEEQKRIEPNRLGADASFTTSALHSAPDGFCADEGERLLRCATRGADVPFFAEPGQTGWRTGQGVAICPVLSLP
jgi:hypothetical protein